MMMSQPCLQLRMNVSSAYSSGRRVGVWSYRETSIGHCQREFWLDLCRLIGIIRLPPPSHWRATHPYPLSPSSILHSEPSVPNLAKPRERDRHGVLGSAVLHRLLWPL